MNLTREVWDILYYLAVGLIFVILLVGILISICDDEIPEKPLREKPVEKFSCLDEGKDTAED